MSKSAEQEARDMLERMGVEDAQLFTAGDLVELANLIAGRKSTERAVAAERERWKSLCIDYAIACGELSKGLAEDDPIWAELKALGERIHA